MHYPVHAILSKKGWTLIIVGAAVMSALFMMSTENPHEYMGFLTADQDTTSPTSGTGLPTAEKLPVAPALVVTVQLQSDGSLQILGTRPFDKDYRFLPHGSAFSPTHRLELTVGDQTYSADVQTSHVTVSEYIGDDNKPHGEMVETPRTSPFEVIVPLPGWDNFSLTSSSVSTGVVAVPDGKSADYQVTTEAIAHETVTSVQ